MSGVAHAVDASNTRGSGWIDACGAVLVSSPCEGVSLDDDARRRSWAQRGERLLTVVCAACGGGVRATLAIVFETPIGAMIGAELALAPLSTPRHYATPHDGHSDRPGWHRRGDHEAPRVIAVLDEYDADAVIAFYCPVRGRRGRRHGHRRISTGELRGAIGVSGARKVLSLR